LYRVLLGSSKAGLGSCPTDHLWISLQKVRGFGGVGLSVLGFVVLSGVFCGVFMLMAEYCQNPVGLGWLKRQTLRSSHRWQVLTCPLQFCCADLWKLTEISELSSLQEVQK